MTAAEAEAAELEAAVPVPVVPQVGAVRTGCRRVCGGLLFSSPGVGWFARLRARAAAAVAGGGGGLW